MINEIYPLAALFIHATNQEITKERIASVLRALGMESHPKICEFFEMDALKVKDLLMSSTQGAPAPAGGAQAAPDASKDAEKKEEPEEEEIEIDFGMF